MPLLAGTRTGAIVAVVGFGIGFGIAHLAAPAHRADRYGTTAYATIAGRLATPVTIARATAPLAAATLLHTTAGYPILLTAVAACCALAATGMLVRATTTPPSPTG